VGREKGGEGGRALGAEGEVVGGRVKAGAGTPLRRLRVEEVEKAVEVLDNSGLLIRKDGGLRFTVCGV